MLIGWVAWGGVVFCLIVLVEVVRGGYLLLTNLQNEPVLTDSDAEQALNPGPLVSVIIPAKDEEPYIAQSIRSALASDYPRLEVIVADDRSVDGTAGVVAEMAEQDDRIELICLKSLPEGWTGKTHALYHAGARARGEQLLFIDADTLVEPHVISRCVGRLKSDKLDMLSVLPGFLERGFSEKVLYPHMALGFSYFYPLEQVNDPASPAGIASGAFILIRKEAYEALGTWKRFRAEVTEDVAMSKVLKAEGMRIEVIRGPELVRTRGFSSVSEVCGYWERTFYGGLEKSARKIGRLVANYIALTILGLSLILSSAAIILGDSSIGTQVLFGVSLLTMIAVIVPYAIFLKKDGTHWAYGLTAPLGIAISAWVTLVTLRTVLAHKGVTWRGSVYR